MKNPLLKKWVLPPFNQIDPSDIKPAIEQVISENKKLISSLEHIIDVNWQTFVEPLQLADDMLNKIWSPVRHLNSVKSSDSLREAYESCLSLLSDYSTEVSQNKKLFKSYIKLKNADSFNELSEAQQKAINDTLLQFRLGGVGLKGKDKEKYQILQKELSQLTTSYENNILDSTQSWEKIIHNEEELKGLPEYAKQMLYQLAKEKSLTGYRITLDMPCYIAVITYADNRDLRKQLYQAFSTRASDRGYTDKKWDNSEIMSQILIKRQQKANLLGFDNFADYSLETKMAKDYQEVVAFLNELADKSKTTAKLEFEQLQKFAKNNGLNSALEAWDVAYYSEKLKQQKFAISDEVLKPYFSDNGVIKGLFSIVKKLYNINITELGKDIEKWNKAVRFFQIEDESGEALGQFYLDLYAREGKRGGAWMDECINRYNIRGIKQLPVAYLTCNLTPPVENNEALFTHDEVITLFHEFGHGLHHLLTEVDVPEVSGINGVEWDAVELPSQFMENYCWEYDALKLFAIHNKTAEVLPYDLFEKMINAKNFQSAMQMMRQLEFSLFDMEVHQDGDINTSDKIQTILNQVRERVSVFPPPEFNKFQNSFSHIFAGGYAAGYYSYKWAEVLSADAFAVFENEGIFNKNTGKRFRNCILSKGGSRTAKESYLCFKGSEPDTKALLRHHGITN